MAFLKNIDSVLSKKLSDYKHLDMNNMKFIIETYEWLICWLIKATNDKVTELKEFTTDRFEVRSLSQVFKARTLAIVLGEYNKIKYMFDVIKNFKKKLDSSPTQLQAVLSIVGILHGLWSLYKHIPMLYQGGFSSDSKLSDWLTNGILDFCQDLKPEVVALVNALDIVLNSVLGASDGKIYEKLMTAFTQENSSSFADFKNLIKSKL